MYTIILVEKSGNVVQKQVKGFDKLYTTCSYRNTNHFEILYTWNNDNNIVYELHGKKTKKLNNENLYTFKHLNETYYGNLCIIKKINDDPVSISIQEWEEFNGCFETKESEVIEEPNDTNNETKELLPYSVTDDKELTYEEYEEE